MAGISFGNRELELPHGAFGDYNLARVMANWLDISCRWLAAGSEAEYEILIHYFPGFSMFALCDRLWQ
jgi:hypothetical protein